VALPENPAPPRQYSDLSIFSYADESESEVSDEPDSAPGSRRWLPIAAFVCLAGIGGYFGYRGLSETTPSAPAPAPRAAVLPLKLAVEEKGDQLDVTWNRNAPAIVAGKRGVLNISDGATQRDLELSSAQLQSGSVLYSRLSGDVTLKLDVYADGQDTVSESIRILASDPAVRPKPAAESTPAPATPSSVTTETPAAPPKKVAARPRQERRPTPSRPAPVSVRKEAAQPVETPVEPPPQPEIEIQRPERRR
jgi:hypothetical protein